MSDSGIPDPYEGNILIQGLGPIRSRQEYLKLLTYLPKVPPKMSGVPAHVTRHLLMELRDFHIPSLENLRIYESVDLMWRSLYRYLDPAHASTWSVVSGEVNSLKRFNAPSYGAAVVGISGTGKTEAITRWLRLFAQVTLHETFPRMVGSHLQLTWLSAEVPASGKLVDVASTLMRAFDAATGLDRFRSSLGRSRRDGMKMMDEWLQVASSHFLGVLHLDEVQNFFTLPTLEARRKSKGTAAPELSIVDDQCLKYILGMMNSGRFALVISGTPDGISAIMRRLSNTERIAMSGYHVLHPFNGAPESDFRRTFLPALWQYQYVQNKLPLNEALAETIINRTGGIQRLVIALWIAAHRVALERSDNSLLLADFHKAADTFLAPVAPAVEALRSMDPKKMSRYEDLLSADPTFWPHFW